MFCQEFLNDKVMNLTAMSEDKSYGITQEKSIKVGSIENEYKYINALTGPNGEIIKASRLMSCCPFKSKNKPEGNAYLDVWQITYQGLQEPITIYLSSYDFDNPKCIKGLNYKREAITITGQSVLLSSKNY